VSPWLVLTTTATPSTVAENQSSTIIASVTRDSDGNTPAGNVFPAGVPVAFATNLGAVSPASAFTASPMASTTFTSSSPGVANVTATMDSATVGTTVTVNPNATAPAAASETSPALPTVSFASPNENGTLGLGDQTPVSLNVSAPAGVGSVGLSFNGRSVCTLTVAPFICQFRPSATDAGRAGTFTAIVTDAQGRAASASRVVVVGGPATLGSHTGLVSNGVARIRIKCAQFGPCRGTLALRSRLGGRHSPLVGIGSTSFNLRSGATRTIRLEISSGALQRLRQKAFLGTRTTVTTGDVALTRNLVLHLK
jgi:hypothetical protein